MLRGESPSRRHLTWLGLLCLPLAACAGVYEATGTASQGDLSQIRSELNGLKAAAQRNRTEADATRSRLEQRLRDQSAETSRQLVAITARLDALSSEVSAITARTRNLGQRGDATASFGDGATKATAVRPGPPPAPTSAPASVPTSTAPPVSAGSPSPVITAAPVTVHPPSPPQAQAVSQRSATGTLQPEDVYQAAYIDFSKGNYALAISGFREFLRRYPDHKLGGSAQYWIGESHLALARGYANAGGQPDKVSQELEEAVREFRKVIANYPRGEKVPTALYKEALTLVELKQVAVAQERLQYLIENFPRAEEVPLAKDRLATLKEK